MKSPARILVTTLALVLFALLLSSNAQAVTKSPPFTQADCADPTLILRLKSQAEVDSFPCTTVAGDLTIGPGTGQTINSLSPGLVGLTRVEGELSLFFASDSSPATLAGLQNLTHVGSISIKGRISNQPDQLTDISALGGLTSIGPRNCQPAYDPTRCFTLLAITSDDITQLPAWNIASDPNVEDLTLDTLPLADPAGFDNLPIPTSRLALIGLTLDTSQPGQLATLARLASQAQASVVLDGISNLVILPGMPAVQNLRLAKLDLPDLSDINAAAFPTLTNVSVIDVAGITPDELAPIRDFDSIVLTGLAGLSGANPLSGLAGGSFNSLTLNRLTNVDTLTDLSAVTSLDKLAVYDLDGLVDLDGLQNLASLVDGLEIEKCDKLQNVDALANLVSIGRTLEIEENLVLQNLDGLGAVSGTLQSNVLVNTNAQLTDISGLAGITGVGDEVFLFANAVTECDVLVQSRLNPSPPKNYYVDPACVYASPTLMGSATALDFGSAPIGSTVDRSVTFQNSTGSISTTVDISALAISGDALGEYSIFSEDCSSGPLTGGSTRNSCTVTVRFTVTQQGVDNAQLDLIYTTSESSTPMTFPVTLHAAGTGVTGVQLIPNTNLDFGAVELGASKTGTITIDNTGGSLGSGPLTVNALNVTGSDFTLTNNSCGNTYPQTVPVGSQCQVSISFTPSALNARAGQFTMDSNGATSPDNVNLLGSGAEPPAPLPNPTSLAFGDVPVGATSATQPLFVENKGALRSLPLGQLSASGDFALQSDSCSGATLAPAGQAGSACAVTVVYIPSTVGAANGTVSIPGASGYPSASVPLSGNGLQPASLTASPNPLAFGTQTAPTTLAVTVNNIGAAGQDIQIGTASVTGTVMPQQFNIDADACSGTTLAGQASCQITVTFDPFQAGADTGTLEIPDNRGQTFGVALSGRGGEPVDYVSPSSLSFGEVEIGSTSAPQTVTVTDNSGIALDIASVTISQGQGFLVQNDGCSGTTVSPGGSCSFGVVFTAISQGAAVGIVDILSNSTSSPDQVALDAVGVTEPQLSLSPSSLNFGVVTTGENQAESVTVTNGGDNDLVIGTLSVGGAAAFSLTSDNCSGATLASGANCSFGVVFAPTSASALSGAVSLPSNDPNSPGTLPLSGEGQLPQDGALIIVKQTAGGDDSFDFTSTALGNFSLTTNGGSAQTSFTNLSVGSYDVTENVPAGWRQTNAACSNGDSPDNVSLAASEVVTCIFENEKLDAITVIKRTVGGDGTFAFTSTSLGDFTLVTTQGEAQTTFDNLVPGTYDIAETVSTGWQLSGTPVCSNGDAPSAITLDAGERVVCVFINLKQDALIIEKVTTGGDGTFDFTSDIPGQGNFSLTTTNGSASVAFDNLDSGTYSVTETLHPDWRQTGASCDNGDAPDAVTLAPGETVTCTFTDEKLDTLILAVQSIGADGNFSFTSTSLNPASFDLQTVGGQATTAFPNLAPGTYDLSESVPAGWVLDSAVCDNGDSPSAVALTAGETVTCTFTNLREDTLIIEKQASGSDRAFSFTSSAAAIGNFDITTVNGVASRNFANLVPGNYDVTETVPDGWDLTGASCDNGDSPDNITLGTGETVTCTFANTELDTITVVKQTTGGDDSFDFTSGSLGDFSLVTSGGTASRSFSNLNPGTYDVAETVPAGWELLSATCDNGDAPDSITLGTGEAVTCTFANTKEDTLTIVKQTIGGDGSFDFTSGALGDFSLVTSGGMASRSFSNLRPGIYDVAETVPAGWELSSATCDNGDDPSAVTLAAGESVTCTFANSLLSAVTGVIEIETQALGGDATFAYESPQLGPFEATTVNGFASNSFASLSPGAYAVNPVAQTAPSDWLLTDSICSDGSVPSAIDLSAGETVTCIFLYERQDGFAEIPTLSPPALALLVILLTLMGGWALQPQRQWY